MKTPERAAWISGSFSFETAPFALAFSWNDPVIMIKMAPANIVERYVPSWAKNDSCRDPLVVRCCWKRHVPATAISGACAEMRSDGGAS